MKHWRSLSLAIVAALVLAFATLPAARAEEAKAPDAAAQPAASAPQGNGMMQGMEGCPGAANGACCGTCQQAAAKQEDAAKAEGGGCPCQRRAKQMAQ